MKPATTLRDARHSIRILFKHKGFAAAAILAFALGIGANTAIFSVINSVLLQPLAYKEPGKLVVSQLNGATTTAPADFVDWKKEARSFEQLAAAQYWGANITGAGKPEWVLGLQVSANMFDLLGVAPFRGRTFLPEDERAGNERVLVISHRLWRQRFGGDPNLIGRVLTLDGKAFTVVGIMPESFAFAPFWATKAQMWAPLMLDERKYDRGGRSLRVFGRLKNGVDLRAAQTEFDTITQRLAQQYPKTNAKFFPKLIPLHEMVVGNIRPTLLVLFGTVGFVLLIACANVANLMLARVTARRREIAVRLAIGASRTQLIAQLLTESMLLSLLGGILGVMIAYWGITGLSAMLPEGSLPRQRELGLDRIALAFTLIASILTGLVAGLIPGWQASKGDVHDALKEGGRSGSEGPGRHRTRGILVACEIALAFVLLIGAGLMIRSFLNIQATDPGFNPRNLLSMAVSVSGTGQSDAAHRAAFYARVVHELEAMPGVKSVSAINHLPIGGDLWDRSFTISGRSAPRPGEELSAVYRVVRPGYFRTMEIPLLQGRDFTAQDSLGAPGVIIVNESLARRHWPGESPIGKRMTLDDPAANPNWLTVVGVSKDAKQFDWTTPVFDEMYLPFLQTKQYLSEPAGHFAYMTFVIRTAGDPIALAAPARSTVWKVDGSVRISDVGAMEQFVANNLWRQRVSLLLLGIFAAVALILAVTGIYGVVSHSVAQKTHEIGVRMALGAQKSDVIGLSLREGMWPALCGVVCGALIALAVSKLMTTLLYQVTPLDPATFTGVAVLMLLVAFAANYLPARRATTIDPMLALRHD